MLEDVTRTTPGLPDAVRPAYAGALFDDEGHISREGKAFISNTDHTLLTGVGEMLAEMGIETNWPPTSTNSTFGGGGTSSSSSIEYPLPSDEEVFDACRALGVCDDDEEPTDYAAAGRTDAGVSALAQTVAFDPGQRTGVAANCARAVSIYHTPS